MAKQYWPTSDAQMKVGAVLELRAELAWRFFEGMACRVDHDALPSEIEALLARAFMAADLFVDRAEARGELRAFTDADVRRANVAARTLSAVEEQSCA